MGREIREEPLPVKLAMNFYLTPFLQNDSEVLEGMPRSAFSDRQGSQAWVREAASVASSHVATCSQNHYSVETKKFLILTDRWRQVCA